MTEATTQDFVIEVETAALGALLDGGEMRGVLAYLNEENFLEPIHREIYAAIRVAHDTFSAVSVPTVMKALPDSVKQRFREETGKDIGGYLSKMVSGRIHGVGSAMAAAKNVVAQWSRLELRKRLGNIAALAASPQADPRDLLKDLGETLDVVGSTIRRTTQKAQGARLDAALDGMLAEAEEAISRGGPAGLATGLVDLDRMTGGLHRRDLILLGARPSMGKTSIATSIALTCAGSGHGVGIFSLEMDTSKLVARMASDLAYRAGVKVPYQSLINAPNRQDLDDVRYATDHFRTLPMWIDQTPNITTAELRAKVEKWISEAAEGGFTIDLIVVDHLLKLSAGGRYAGQRVLEIGEITGTLKELARDFDMAVLLLTQLSRGVEGRDDKRPQLSDLRDSGAIEQDADVVMMLYREAYYLERKRKAAKSADEMIDLDDAIHACRNKAEVLIEKQRNGGVGSVDVFVDLPFSHFANAARDGYADMRQRYGSAE